MRLIFLLVALACAPALQAAPPEYPSMGADIYDVGADGETLIAAAIKQAGEEGKRVLLFFGANWCPYCRRLHQIIETDSAVVERLRATFVLVHVDANTRRNKERNATVIARYGNPLRLGLPVFVVLEGDGTPLATQESGSLAAPTDEAVAERLREFLQQWTKPGATK